MDRDEVLRTLGAVLDADDDLARTLRRIAEVASVPRGAGTAGPSRLHEVELRPPSPDDEAAWIAAVTASTRLHAGWVSPPSDAEGYAGHLDRFAPDDQVSLSVWWRGRLAGVVNLQNIVRGNYLGTNLGYYAFEGAQGRGVMRAAVAKATDVAFGELGLHRVEAGIQPNNHASIRLVQTLGYRFEGLLPRLVRVDDVWRDHELWATTSQEWPGAEAALAP